MGLFGENTFRNQIDAAWQSLSRVTEEESQRPTREGGWSPKEILGHLIDSALNNHQRFVRAALDGRYEGPTYQQSEWVRIHGYGSMPWDTLLNYWHSQNELLCEVVIRIPEEHLEATCRIGDNDPVSLGFLVTDYLHHLDNHVRQIGKTAGQPN